MELLPRLLEASHVLAWTLIHFLWQGLVIGALYECGKRLAHGSIRKQHHLALAALLALLLAPVLTFQYLYQGGGAALLPSGVVASTGTAATPAELLATSAETLGAVEAGSYTNGWTMALTMLWLLGAVLASLTLVRDLRRLRRAIATSREPPTELKSLLLAQMERLGIRRPVRLRLTATVHSPGVYGLLRPVILLPIALALSLPRDQLETLIAHELAHVRRADYIGNLLAIAARTLLYFHPVVHRICRDLETARETLCDDMVIGLRLDPLKYARALSKAEEYRQQVPMPLLTATGGLLSLRVRRILDLPVERQQRRGSRAPLLLVVALVLTVLAAGQRLATMERSLVRPDLGLAVSLIQQVTPSLLPAEAIEPAPPVLTPLTLAASAADVFSDSPTGTPEQAQLTAPPPATPTIDRDVPTAFAGDLVQPLQEQVQIGAEVWPTEPLSEAVALAADTIPAPVRFASEQAVGSDSPATTDATGTEAVERRSGIAVTAQRPEPVRVVTPNYPRDALRTYSEGVVQVEYRIDANGRPTAIRAVGNETLRVFVEAATTAMGRWRFPAGAASENQVFVQEFSFRLDQNVPDSYQCELTTGTRICRRPNR